MIEITNLRQGAILNSNHGIETSDALEITVQGISENGLPVFINDNPAEMDGRFFTCQVKLTQKFNTVVASVITPYGKFSQELVLVWDKASRKRYNMYIDDHSFLFTDLAKERPKSAFDHFYLKGLKDIHDTVGLKVSLNIFYKNDHDKDGFTLDKMPDIWKNEFEDNSDWLKFAFHSYSEFPDRPYLESTPEEFGSHWDLVQNEIYRFAGEKAYIAPIVIHWANIHPTVAAEMIKRGTICYSSSLRARVMGGPSLADRQKGGNMNAVQARSVSGADKDSGTIGLKMHYDYQEETSYLTKHNGYYDPSIGIFFFTGCCCGNLVPLKDIRPRVEAAIARSKQSGCNFINCASHEQYTFPYYSNYLPDHMDRLKLMATIFNENGYEPCFFNEGVLGNTAWEK